MLWLFCDDSFGTESKKGSGSDSLQQVLSSVKGRDRVNILNLLSESFQSSEPARAFNYAKEASELALKIKFAKGLAQSYNNLGVVLTKRSSYQDAIAYFRKAIHLYDSLNESRAVALCYNNIGSANYYTGNYPEALSSFFTSLKLLEVKNDPQISGEANNNIGVIYMLQKDNDKALDHFRKAMRFYYLISYTQGIASAYSNIGIIWRDKGQADSALSNHLRALELREKINDRYGIGSSYTNLASVYSDQRNYQMALKYDQLSLSIKKDLGDQKGMAISYTNIGSDYTSLKQYDKAIESQQNALTLAFKIKAPETIKYAYQGLGEICEAKGDHKNALAFFKRYTQVKDSLLDRNKLGEMAELKANYELDKKRNVLEQEAKIKEAAHQASLARRTLILYSVVAAAFLLFLLMLVSYRAYRQKKKSHQLLENRRSELENANQKISVLNHGLKTIHEIDRSILAAHSLDDIAKASLKHLLNLFPAVERASFITFNLQLNQAKMLAVAAKKTHSLDTGLEFTADSLTAYASLVKGEVKIVNDIKALQQLSDSDKELIKQGLNSYTMLPLMYEEELIGSLNLSASAINTFGEDEMMTIREVGNELALAVQQFRFKEIIRSKNSLLEDKNKNITDSINYARRIQSQLMPSERSIEKMLKRLKQEN